MASLPLARGAPAANAPPPRAPRRKSLRGYPAATICCALLILALTYLPFLFVIENSFKSAAQYASDPVGLQFTFHGSNYAQAWDGMDRYLLNTVIVAAISVAIGVPAAAVGAYAFAHLKLPGKRLLFVAFFGLLMIPWTLTLIPLYLEVRSYHLLNSWFALVLPYAAGAQPLNVFLFRTFFEGIPDELIASARVDGCGEMKILARIVAPLAMPILLTGTVLMFVSAWGDYLWPQLVLQNTNMLTVSSGLELFLGSFGNNGGASGPQYAAFVIVMIPVMLLVGVTMKYFVRGITRGAVK